MRVNQRQVVIGAFALLIVGGIVSALYYFSIGRPVQVTTSLVSILLIGALGVAYLYGWDHARYALIGLIAVTVGVALPEPFVTQFTSTSLLLVPVVALVLGNPAWVVGSTLVALALLVARGGPASPYLEPTTLLVTTMTVIGIIVSRLITDTTQLEARESAGRAEAALAEARASAAELEGKAEQLTVQNEEQRRLIDLVASLETPSVALADGVLLAPVVGHLDTRRAGSLTERLLRDVATSRARLVVLDLAGVAAVDTGVAQALLRAVQAVRLLGCDVTITGISASIAATMTELGISMAGVRTARTPQEALAQATAPAASVARQN